MQNVARYALIIILCLNVHPSNQLRAKSEVAHCASFLAMLHLLHSITKNSMKSLNTLDTENTGGKHALPEGSHIVLLQIDI